MPRKAKHPTGDYKPVAPFPEQKYLTVKNAAAYLGATVSFIRHELVYAKGCPYVRLGSRIVFDKADLEAFMDHKREEAA